MHFYIRNMVCPRCITAVKQLLQQLELSCNNVQLGEVILDTAPTTKQLEQFKTGLQSLGFELIDDARAKTIEMIKTLILERVHYDGDDKNNKLSVFLTGKIHKSYSYLSHLFSEVEGVTIEKYFIQQKIERAKELLVYNEMSLGEISFQLGYSSVAHLSSQFKAITGLTPSQFKKQTGAARRSLDSIGAK